jgi:phosphate-selective porin OprO and OprP
VVLTGERASYDGIVPDHPVHFGRGEWGALEVVARVEQLRADPAAFPVFADPSASATSALAWGAGFNWYLSRNAKISSDYERTVFKGGAPGGGNRQSENAFLERIQVSF